MALETHVDALQRSRLAAQALRARFREGATDIAAGTVRCQCFIRAQPATEVIRTRSHLTLFHSNLFFLFRLLVWPPSSLKCHCTLHDALLTEFHSMQFSVSVSMPCLISVHFHSSRV
jgi:hypothetical protein